MTDTLIPLLQDIEPVALRGRTGWRRISTCTVDAKGVEWNGERMQLEDITAVAYSSRSHSLNLIQRRVERRIRLFSAAGCLRIDLGNAAFGPNVGPEHAAIYQTVLSSVEAGVEPRLRAEALRNIAAGETVRFGPLRLNRDGLWVDGARKRLEWRQLPAAHMERGKIVVRATIEHDARPLCRIGMLSPSAVLLPELLAEATVPFT